MITGTFHTNSEGETHALAERLARSLRGGDVIALRGALGAGKTAFVRGLAAGLGIDADVSSPTFTLVQEYRSAGSPVLYHFDMYRVTNEDSLETTGFYDYLNTGGVIAVEWSEQIGWAIPPGAVTAEILATGSESRVITISGGRPQ